jgi:hypothetical protein
MRVSTNDQTLQGPIHGPITEILEQFQHQDPQSHSALSARNRRILEKITSCGKQQLGHIYTYCDTCHANEFVGWCHCNDRNCPNCGARYREEWCEKVQERLPDGRYFHLVFTIPHEFNQLLFTENNRWIIFDTVMKAAADTIKVFAKNRFNAEPFILSVLHTWSQDLSMHIHSHSLVSAEMFDEQNDKWRRARDFLFPSRAMAKVFRGKFLSMLASHIDADYPKRQLTIKDGEARIDDWLSFAERLPRKWNVYVSKPRKSHKNVVKYFACYANRTALTNRRIAGFDETNVYLFPKRKDQNEPEQKTQHSMGKRDELIVLPVNVFIKKLCSHFLPAHFTRIRYYGLASPSSKNGKKAAPKSGKQNPTPLAQPKERAQCQHCFARTVSLIIVRKIPRQGIVKKLARPLFESSS